VIYCDACGEPVEGRYCRMCGAPVPDAHQASQQHQGRHGAAQRAYQGSGYQGDARQYSAEQYGAGQYSAGEYGAAAGQYSAGHAGGAASGMYSPTSQVPSVQGSLAQAPVAYAPVPQYQGDPLTDPLPADPAQQAAQYVSQAQAAAAYGQQATQYVPSAPYAQNQAATQYAPAQPPGSPLPFDQNRQATQYLPADQLPGQQAQQQPTQYIAPQARQALPTPPVPGDPNFDLLFRGAQSAGDDGRTRMLSPVDMPPGMPGMPGMPAPSAQPYAEPPVRPGGPGGGGPGGYDDTDSDGPNQKLMIWGTFGAVGVVVVIILGLLYLGGGSGGGSPAASTANSATAAAGSATPTVGTVTLPSASLSPSASPSPSPSPSPTGNSTLPLSQGSSGTLVTYVQQRLNQLGYYQGQATGQYDGTTAEAVVQFQGAAHVTADPAGTVGSATLTAIIAAGSQPDLKAGHNDSTADVERLQEALNVADNAGLTVNGSYDGPTTAAVAAYQSAAGIQPTGAMNAQTWQALQMGTLG
jgi:peptidoglycan hydrolase-like protein with peptidoglycan-binding domain